MNRFARIVRQLKWCLLLPLLAAISFAGRAQSGKATATLDSAQILIGGQTRLLLQYEIDKAAIVNWPSPTDTLSAQIEIISRDSVSRTLSGATQRFAQTFTITCFDSGSYTIPPFLITWQRPGDTSRYADTTLPLTLMVSTVKVDTTAAIRDIKGPLSEPYTLRELLPWILGGLGVLLLAGLVIYILVRRKSKKPLFSSFRKPELPAHLEALAALEQLRQQHLWQQGRSKEYHSHLSDILRRYIERRWALAAPEMITPDLIGTMSGQEGISGEPLQSLKIILELADSVKFARFEPLPDEHDRSMMYAVHFVETTAEHVNGQADEQKSGEPEKDREGTA